VLGGVLQEWGITFNLNLSDQRRGSKHLTFETRNGEGTERLGGGIKKKKNRDPLGHGPKASEKGYMNTIIGIQKPEGRPQNTYITNKG